MLLKVSTSHPRYANIVNFMVSGYVPLGENMKKLIYESRRHFWDAPYLYRVCADGLLWRCVPTAGGQKKLKNAMQHHMEDIMVSFAPKRKSCRVDSFGYQYMKILRTSYGDAQTARDMEALQLVMRCP